MSVVACTCLGGLGRLGNQLFQYAHARAYAESIGAKLYTNRWIGRELFEGVDESIMDECDWERTEEPNGRDHVNLWGYFQRPHHLELLSRAKLKKWLRPKAKYRKNGHDLVFHKRRGDYIEAGCYALVTDKSYEDGARKFGYDPSSAKVYGDDRPVEATYDDLFEMVASKVIFRANSSYSWWAATLSDGVCYAPVVGEKTGWLDAEFVRGNHPQTYYLFGELKIGE